jgi:hypothetical protein
LRSSPRAGVMVATSVSDAQQNDWKNRRVFRINKNGLQERFSRMFAIIGIIYTPLHFQMQANYMPLK